MSLTVTVYTFELRNEDGTYEPDLAQWYTQDFQEADDYARTNQLRIIASEYEWADSELVGNDYTNPPGEYDEDEEAPDDE